jgi:signal transduction histidine kinase
LIQDDDGFFWLGGMGGILRVASEELERACSSPSDRIKFEHFGFDEGVRGFVRQAAHGYPGFGYPLATKSADGRLWFSTSRGLAVIDPHNIPRNMNPPMVYIQKVVAGGVNYGNSKRLVFRKGTRDCEIDYAGLCFANPMKVRYQYRLEGYDSQWVDAGSRRQAFYANLRPKQYRFQVCACNNDGIWNTVGDSLEFSILPVFYETNWFAALGILVLGFVIFGLHLLRLARITARMRLQARAQQEERQRIALELHDTLLQGFAGIGLKLFALARKEPKPPPEMQARLYEILEESDQCLDEARQSVWKLRSASLEKADDFSKALSGSIDRLLARAGVRVTFSVEGTARTLAPAIEDNLLRICEEALANAVKHANPNLVQVRLEFDAKTVQLQIRDNGSGFDPRNVDSASSGHFGLSGMRERVESLKGLISINSQLGQGTEITVTIPAD